MINSKKILEIKDLHVSAEDKEILHGINLTVNKGETHVLMGPNGAGKSTLGYALMGNPRYKVESGNIIFEGQDIVDKAANKRAAMGMFLSFQSPVEVPGISLERFLKNALEQKTKNPIRLWDFHKELEKAMEVLNMDKEYARRDLNVGFSGGEKKKTEILQMLMLKPTLAILDETDSGLDVDAIHTVSMGVNEYQKDKKGSLIIITHNTRILEYLHVDAAHIICDGKVVATGDASLIEDVNKNGFERYIKEA